MLLFLDNYYDITSLYIWYLIALTMLCVLLAIGSTLVNLDCKLLFLLLNLLALAVFAHLGRVDGLALATALVTGSGTLRVHTGSQLHHYCAHTTALAGLACLDSLGVGSANTVALVTETHAFNLNLSLSSIVQVL